MTAVATATKILALTIRQVVRRVAAHGVGLWREQLVAARRKGGAIVRVT